MQLTCGCCLEDTGIITVRAFDAADGEMLWEVPNFYTTAKSPDNTLWGWSVTKITPPDYTRREEVSIPITSGGSQPGGSTWTAKTNPGSYGTDISTITIDLAKVSSSGVKTLTVPNWMTYTGPQSTLPRALFSDFPAGLHSDVVTLYRANNDGKVLPIGDGFPDKMLPSSGSAQILVNDLQINGLVMKMTLRPLPIIKSASAGSNNPMWVFRRASTNASFPLYGTSSEVVTALSALPGVTSVTATGGPCCLADMNIEVTWANAANTFSDAWITYSSTPAVNRNVWDWTTGTASHLLNFTPWSFLTDGLGLINSGVTLRRNLRAATSTPYGDNTVNIWTASPLSTYTQTNERTRVSSSTIWEVVPVTSGLLDVKNGRILFGRTRSRVPVVEPSSAAMTTHAIISESTGAITTTHDSLLNPIQRSWLNEAGSIGTYGGQYGYAHQGGDEGVATVPGASYFANVPGRSHSGRHFATGTGTMFEPFSTQSEVIAISDSYAFSSNIGSELAAGGFRTFDWNFTTYGALSSVELFSAGNYVACRWQAFAANTPIFGIPAHRREYWMTFSGALWPAFPPDCEYRYIHANGTTPVHTTAWLPFSATTAEVEAELQAWYGEPISGYPTIRIVGTVEPHDFQDQPFWQYMPLAHIEIWTDATGETFAPRGRVLALQFRNGTAFQRRAIVGMSRTTGVINWQKDAGLANTDYTPGLTKVGGTALYSTDDQLVVATLCRPVLQDDVYLGSCEWVWDGAAWVIETDMCSPLSEAVAPSDPGTTIGQVAAGTCSLL